MSDYISEDLLLLIFKSSRVKTLLRYRCVCKLWKEMVDSRSFILQHLAVQKPRLFVLDTMSFKYNVLNRQTLDEIQSEDYHLDYSLIGFKLSSCPTVERGVMFEGFRRLVTAANLHVVCCVAGIVCLYNTSNFILLWNPSIRRVLKIPLPKADVPFYNKCGMWIDLSTNTFKVVRLYGNSKIAVFSSAKQSWKEIAMEGIKLGFLQRSWAPNILIEGVAHWGVRDNSGRSVIISFDFIQEKLGTIEYPNFEELMHDCFWTRLTEWKKCVSVLHWENLSPFRCDLWAMKDGSWSKMFSVNLSDEPKRVLSVVEDNGWIIAHFIKGPIVLFDPKNGSIARKSKLTVPDYSTFACNFVESLVFPDMKFISAESL